MALIKALGGKNQAVNWGHHCLAESSLPHFDMAHLTAGFMAGAAD